jgi:hypothetical protein
MIVAGMLIMALVLIWGEKEIQLKGENIMQAMSIGQTSMIFACIVIIIGLAITLMPTIIAFVKGTGNKVQVLLINIIPFGMSIMFVFLFVATIIGVINISFSNRDIISWILIFVSLWISAMINAIRGS